MLAYLTSLIPELANYIGDKLFQKKIPEIVHDVVGSSIDEVRPAELTEDQKQKLQSQIQALISQAEVAKSVQETIRLEALSEHWLVYSWRPLAILGCGFLLFLMTAFACGFGGYWMIHDKEVFERFLKFYGDVGSGMFERAFEIFSFLVGGLAVLRSVEKVSGVKSISLSGITKLFKK